MTALADEYVTFIQHQLPGLDDGSYELTGEPARRRRRRQADQRRHAQPPLPASRSLGDRFRLATRAPRSRRRSPRPTRPASSRPWLPHVVFTNTSFPWARSPAKAAPVAVHAERADRRRRADLARGAAARRRRRGRLPGQPRPRRRSRARWASCSRRPPSTAARWAPTTATSTGPPTPRRSRSTRPRPTRCRPSTSRWRCSPRSLRRSTDLALSAHVRRLSVAQQAGRRRPGAAGRSDRDVLDRRRQRGCRRRTSAATRTSSRSRG